MSDVHWEKVQLLIRDLSEPNIEGVIYKTEKGIWVAFFMTDEGVVLRVQVDYCPWCGKELAIIGQHSH